jgi:hypothetical protein
MTDFNKDWYVDCPKCNTHITNTEFICENCGGNIKGEFITVHNVTSEFFGCSVCANVALLQGIKCTNSACGITIGRSLINESGKKKSGCFIATAVYGNYDASEVKTLREFRDRHLQTNVAGRAFVRVYYKLSPTIANSLIRNPRLSRVMRKVLDKIVCRIRSEVSQQTNR